MDNASSKVSVTEGELLEGDKLVALASKKKEEDDEDKEESAA